MSYTSLQAYTRFLFLCFFVVCAKNQFFPWTFHQLPVLNTTLKILEHCIFRKINFCSNFEQKLSEKVRKISIVRFDPESDRSKLGKLYNSQVCQIRCIIEIQWTKIDSKIWTDRHKIFVKLWKSVKFDVFLKSSKACLKNIYHLEGIFPSMRYSP